MNNNFSDRFRRIMRYSREEADRLQTNYLGPEHILLGIIRNGEGLAVQTLTDFGVELQELKNELDSTILKQKKTPDHSSDITLSHNAEKVLKMSILESKLTKSSETDSEHLLLAIIKESDNLAAQLLNELNINYKDVFMYIERMWIQSADSALNPQMGADFTEEDDDEDDEDDNFGKKPSTGKARTQVKPTSETPILDKFSSDLTQAARENKLDPIVGRDHEIERVAQILSRRKKNNPVLIGDPGVGKSAIVEGLAQRIVQKRAPHVLLNKRIIALDMASIVAGTKYRGQFEERIKAVLNELVKNPNVIVFMDEIHTLVGAGSASGSLDAANMMKPALARGEIQCIGATTLDEYRKSIEKDGALERRFQKIIVQPTTADETLQILKNIRSRYEEHHNVKYTDQALQACVSLAERYISDRNFPDKAIDVMDEAGARTHISEVEVPQNIQQIEEEIAAVNERKSLAIKEQRYELAADLRDRIKTLNQQLDEEEKKWKRQLTTDPLCVDEEKVAETLAVMTGVPVYSISENESAKLLGMSDALKKSVIAQDQAVDTIVKAIQRNRVGLKDPNRPIGAFMFLGPTGVGKTHLAKKIAEQLFDTTEALIRIDMSEYMEKFNVSRLVGAPPGYVGYEEGGLMTEKVRRRPYSVVLLDEIEKAHPDVFNLLLQIMDEGHLTDSLGRKIDFKNTLLIMTSNVGTRQLKDFGKGIGFAGETSLEADKKYARDILQKSLNKTFSPEFLNRVDEIVIFDQLDREAIGKITDIELAVFHSRIQQLGCTLLLDQEARNFLIEKGYDSQYGARPLKRAIQTYLENEIAEFALAHKINNCDNTLVEVSLDRENSKLLFNVKENTPAL